MRARVSQLTFGYRNINEITLTAGDYNILQRSSKIKRFAASVTFYYKPNIKKYDLILSTHLKL